jgi:hypothetical protein
VEDQPEGLEVAQVLGQMEQSRAAGHFRTHYSKGLHLGMYSAAEDFGAENSTY